MRFLRLALSMSGLRRSCGVIESMIAHCRFSTESSRLAAASWFFIFAMPGIMPIRPDMPPIFCICLSCSRRSVRSNAPLRMRSAVRRAFSASILAAAFSTSETMSPMPRMRPAMRCGSKVSSASIFSPVPISLIGLPVTARIDKCGAAAAVAVDAGHHDAGEADALVEGAREIDRVLTGQRIGDQQHFMRVGGALHLGRFRHHRFVERDAAGGIEQHHVIAAELRGFDGAACDLRRILAGNDRQGVDADLLAEHRKLLHRGRTAGIERGHQHLALGQLGEALGDLGGGGGFAGALQADHHDRDRRRAH